MTAKGPEAAVAALKEMLARRGAGAPAELPAFAAQQKVGRKRFTEMARKGREEQS